MVVFNCNTCGESLKKNQVEKHYLTVCRHCEVLSCVDCGKDFWGDGYKEHTKCISEEEKYSGKNYKPKASANKGEAKQEAWLEKVQTAIDNANPEPRVRNLLETLKEYPNIPRKKAKFENFLGNSLRVRDRVLSSKVWDLLMETIDQTVSPAAQQNGADQQRVTGQHIEGVKENKTTVNNNSNHPQDREENTEGSDGNTGKDKKSKKHNKRKHKDKGSVEDENSSVGDKASGKRKKGKRKSEDSGGEMDGADTQDVNGNADESPVCKKPKTKIKFDWGEVIYQVLRSKTDQEISIKKLKKKVIAEYLAQGGGMKSEEKLWAKFHKKVTKNPNLKVLKDRVKLLE